MLVEGLGRLFGIFAIAGVAVFCLLDALNDIRKGHIAALPTLIVRQPSNTVRDENPVQFWIGVALKLSCAAAATLFVLMYFVVAMATR